MTDQAVFHLQEADGINIITASGEIDIANIDQFRAFIFDAARDKNGAIVISLDKVSYLDSHTLAALVDFGKRLRTNRRRLLVVAPNGSPSGRILRTTGMELAIAMCESLDDALQILRTA